MGIVYSFLHEEIRIQEVHMVNMAAVIGLLLFIIFMLTLIVFFFNQVILFQWMTKKDINVTLSDLSWINRAL